MTKPSRSIAFAALLLTCVLLSAGFVSHGHGGEDLGHDHDCTLCCLHDHFALTTTTAPVPVAPVMSAPVVASMGDHQAPLGARTTRGPPA